MKQHKLTKILILVALAIVMCVLPFHLSSYNVGVLTILLINIIMVVSFRLIVTTGAFSLAHVALMGVGSYTSALLTRFAGWPFWASLPISGLVAGLIALLLSYPLVRMRGFAFFIGSFAFGEAIRLCFLKFKYPFGGASGIISIPRPNSISIPGGSTINFANPTPYYFMTLIVCAVSLFILFQINRSRLAHTFESIYSQEDLAKSVGISLTRYKTLAFMIGSSFAGIAGVLLAHYQGVIDPHLFAWTPMMYILIWAVVGGTHTFIGPIIGAVLFTGIDEALRVYMEWRPLFYGVILIIVLLFLPEGLESVRSKARPLAERLRHWTKGKSKLPATKT